MSFIRLRRLRKSQLIRNLVSQTQVSANDLIMPYFVIEGRNKKESITTMPGVYRLTLDNLLQDLQEIKALGIKAILLFGVSRKKDRFGSYAYSQNGIIQKTVKAIKRHIKGLVIITDVCLCGYTTHGHCGVVKALNVERSTSNVIIDNDLTLKILAKIALSHAEAGADFVAPSAMMDGQVKAIRDILDRNGFKDVGILAYSAKFASNFYGPFREALDSQAKFGDRKTYQMDFRNQDEALREIRQDTEEGADIVMVKPALTYLDVIQRAKENFQIPIAAYNVSGEYALVKIGAQKGIVNEKEIVLEILTAIKRAGADLIITYHAKDVARWLTS